MMHIYAEKFRGFEKIDVDMDKVNFLMGDNSSGKSSILYLISAMSRDDLADVPKFDEDLGLSEYDYFSPYFNNSPVIFAYYDDSEKFAKTITVKDNKYTGPYVDRCTYRVDDVVVTIKKKGDSVGVRCIKEGGVSEFRDVVKIHKSEGGFRSSDLINGQSIGGPLFALMSIGKDDSLDKFRRGVLTTKLDGSRLASPVRALPDIFYKHRRKFNSQGRHFASMWIDVLENEDSKLSKIMHEFGRESGLFDGLTVRKIARKMRESPLVVVVSKNNRDFFLHQVGVGVSQIVPILIDSAYCVTAQEVELLLQQPELHLHPKAQAAFGTYLFQVSRMGLRGVYETHSSFLLDRFRAEIRDQEKNVAEGDDYLPFSDVNILFCENSDSGNSATNLSLDENGMIEGEPESYHNFFVDELVRTIF